MQEGGLRSLGRAVILVLVLLAHCHAELLHLLNVCLGCLGASLQVCGALGLYQALGLDCGGGGAGGGRGVGGGQPGKGDYQDDVGL